MDSPLTTLLMILGLGIGSVLACEEMMKCMGAIEGAGNAGNMEETCRVMTSSVECMEKAFDTCSELDGVSESQISELRSKMDSSKQQLASFCGGGTPGGASSEPNGEGYGTVGVPDDPKCKDIMMCMFDVSKLEDAIKAKDFKAACGLLQPSVKCQRTALKDCSNSNIIPAEDLKKTKDLVANSEKTLNQHCSSGGKGGNTAPMMAPAVVPLFLTFILAILGARLTN